MLDIENGRQMMGFRNSVKLKTTGQFKLNFESLVVMPLAEMENLRMFRLWIIMKVFVTIVLPTRLRCSGRADFEMHHQFTNKGINNNKKLLESYSMYCYLKNWEAILSALSKSSAIANGDSSRKLLHKLFD